MPVHPSALRHEDKKACTEVRHLFIRNM
ncbi:hypothetical protein Nmel_000775, partial [Mimus melanotis]